MQNCFFLATFDMAPAVYLQCPEKKCHYIFTNNFAKYWPIFKILSKTDLAVNFS